MISAKIIRKVDGFVSHEYVHDSWDQVNQWIEKGRNSHNWGYKPDRWLSESEGNHIATREITTGNILISDSGIEYCETKTEYFFPSEYVIDAKDITEELNAIKLKKEQELLSKQNEEILIFNKKVKSLIIENEELKAEILRLEEAKIPRIEKLRISRDELLSSTDHTQLADFYNVLISKGVDAQKEIANYRLYRQYLRDVPSKYPSLEVIPAFSEWKRVNNL